MKISLKFTFISWVLFMTGCHHHNVNKYSSSNNKWAAEKYFADELKYNATPHTINHLISSNQKDFSIVDVRAEKDYLAGHIPGAVNIPYDQWDALDQNPDKEIVGLNKNGVNYIYCYELLCNLAQEAAVKFSHLGYSVKEIKGGFKSWKEYKFPVEK